MSKYKQVIASCAQKNTTVVALMGTSFSFVRIHSFSRVVYDAASVTHFLQLNNNNNMWPLHNPTLILKRAQAHLKISKDVMLPKHYKIVLLSLAIWILVMKFQLTLIELTPRIYSYCIKNKVT